MSALPANLIASADEIDNRLGPLSGRSSDRIAVELREAASHISRAAFEVREKVAASMLLCGLATGHGDTLESLLTEMVWQVERLQNRALELTPEQAAIDLARERMAADDRKRFENMSTDERCRPLGDGFINDYD